MSERIVVALLSTSIVSLVLLLGRMSMGLVMALLEVLYGSSSNRRSTTYEQED